MWIWYTLSHGSPRDEIQSSRSSWTVTVTGSSWTRFSSSWNPTSTSSLWAPQSISVSRKMVGTKGSSDENALPNVLVWNLFIAVHTCTCVVSPGACCQVPVSVLCVSVVWPEPESSGFVRLLQNVCLLSVLLSLPSTAQLAPGEPCRSKQAGLWAKSECRARVLYDGRGVVLTGPSSVQTLERVQDGFCNFLI